MSNKSNKIDVNWLSQQIGRPSIYNIVHKVITLIESGEIRAGASFPSIRVLAKALNLSSTTVATALSELKARNIIQSKQGIGSVVIDNPITAFPLRLTDFSTNNTKSILDLSYAIPDYALLPKTDKAINYALKKSRFDHIKRYPIIPELKEAVLKSWPYQAESFMALNNPFETITHLLELFVPQESYIAIETPFPINELDQLRRKNIRLIGVECDQEGPIIKSLAKALCKKPALFIYQPRENFVTGHAVSKKRMTEMAKLFQSHKAKILIVEHDIISDLSLLPPSSLGEYLPEQTIYIRSYLWIYNTDLCFIVLSGAKRIIQQLFNYRACTIGWSSHLLQLTLAYLLEDEKSQFKIQQAKETYIQRYHALLEALKKRKIYLPFDNRQHLCLWLPVDSEQKALELLELKKIIALAGSHFMVTESKKQKQYIRIMTSGLATKKLINQVANAIALVILTPIIKNSPLN